MFIGSSNPLGASIDPTELSFTSLQQVDRSAVSGSAVTSVDITGLDLEGDGGTYIIVGYMDNALAAGLDIYMYANGDTTGTNYYHQRFGADHNSLSGARGNSPVITGLETSLQTAFIIHLSKMASCKPLAFSTNAQPGAAMRGLCRWWNWETTSNITQLTFTGSSASGIDVGSFIEIWKVV